MSTAGFTFAQGNLSKLLAIPKYLLSILFSWCVPRDGNRWVFGSGIGVGEGALAVARALRDQDSDAEIAWLVSSEREADDARAAGFTPVLRTGWAGYMSTLRAGQIVVTHGLGDVNRFGIRGARVIQLWHGAPLKRLHLDSPVTTTVRGPVPVRALLRKMYLAGAQEVDLYVAGSPLAADRLRSAFRVAPGKVRVLGDPRDDVLAQHAADPESSAAARTALDTALEAGGRIAASPTIILYAPTWRDGAPDPAVPSATEAAQITAELERLDAHLLIRSHPLGLGGYDGLLGERVHLAGADLIRDITPVLGGIDLLVTDYSSIALDYSLLGRPIVWFAPDLARYTSSRGLYEPLEVTSGGRVEQDWAGTLRRLTELLSSATVRRAAESETRALAARFHAFPDGGAAHRVLTAARRLALPASELVAQNGVFFESFYGRQVSCNPLALDREIAQQHPELPRYWSVTSESQRVPGGAVPVLVGGPEWHAARRSARLLVVNDWLRYGFRRRRGQVVLQTWHGTMLKHLALGRPGVGIRTRIAIRRESRRWSLLLSQNPHATEQFRSSYAYRGEILETGYPRTDRLARAVVAEGRHPIAVRTARSVLGIPAEAHVLVYAPTWRDGGVTVIDELNVQRLAEELGEDWVVVARGHTRTHSFGTYGSASASVIDASTHDDVNDVILAADLLVTDYSSIMFDAAVAQVPMLFFVPDLPAYRDRERGFTFDFEREAPGPLLTTRAELVTLAHDWAEHGANAAWAVASASAAEAWRERFTPHDDGHAAERVVAALVERGALSS
ncbi:CDP-glycerol glycerophosphotransferase (TagB/SpsB family) [Leucobacter luti]|uniref:CDP-glycerol glycerophosphotransferase family protein n=1 Tax=Leucobacter luti TaxID=340320 RepID=UPI00104F198E|nr:CDP-glycerol glycerophosphotransferase family protein [Leucobacter luti]MCW2287488.1 CDP-glycerol glycerophosphotransferase (TagB/SpsB family) [Leucobacter luti]TCK41710.1 CDP-glycerol glycerophosphotransferase (TagB/SpsB family) [Leucobacter luti]